MHKERGNILVVIVCVVALLFLISLFKSEHNFFDAFNLKGILRLECGLTVKHPDPKETAKAVFPLTVDGYANGCGWEREGLSAGTAQIFDGKGRALTLPVILAVPENSLKAPNYFSAELTLSTPPETDNGNILLVSTTGLLFSIPIAF